MQNKNPERNGRVLRNNIMAPLNGEFKEIKEGRRYIEREGEAKATKCCVMAYLVLN